MIVFSVIRLKVSAISPDYKLFINHAPQHAPHHAPHHASQHTPKHTLCRRNCLLFWGHIPILSASIWKTYSFSQNYDYLTNTEELIIPKFMELTEFTTWPSVAEVKYKWFGTVSTWAPYTYRRCKWSWQQGELLCCFDFLVPCTNPMQTTGTQEWLWKCWDAIVCGWPPCSERGSATVIVDWIPLVAF